MNRRTIIAAACAFASVVGFNGALNAQSDEPVDWSHIPEMSVGADDAPVTLIEYASLTCPYCADFHTDMLPLLQTEFIEQGYVRYVYREVFFDRFSLWAAMVARCGGEEKFWELTAYLYETQSTWRIGETSTEVVNNLRDVGQRFGLSEDELDACLQDQDLARALVARSEDMKAEYGFTSTPAYVINGETYVAMPYERLRELIEAELRE